MARRPRMHYSGARYHVILRGNDRQDIYFRPADRELWQAILMGGLERYDSGLHCYCWMTNHVHMVIEVADIPLGALIRFVASQYSRKINLAKHRTGHLFERRYRAILIKDENYLKGLVRYIHNNPVRAGLVERPIDYRWSSHSAYSGNHVTTWLQTKLVLSTFGTTSTSARRAYNRFMAEDDEAHISTYRNSVPPKDEDETAPDNRDKGADCGDSFGPRRTLEQIVSDPNGYKPGGLTRYDSTKWKGRRCTAATAHLKPALGRPNLRLEIRALARRVIVEGNRAVGIEYDQRGPA